MKDISKKATQKISINENSQKPLIDSQTSLIDEYKKCEKCDKLEKIILYFCKLIDPTRQKNIKECIEDLQKLIEQYKVLEIEYKNYMKFIKQQHNGRERLDLDVANIKYLRDSKKMTFEEIAKKYNVSRNTIRNRYYEE